MQVVILETPDLVASYASKCVVSMVNRKPSATLGLATGNTPIKMYEKLVSSYQNTDVSFAEVTTFNLDEYIGLEPNHPQSYCSFMAKHFFDHIDIDTARTFLPHCGTEAETFKIGEAYEATIQAHGGIDLQVLGIGRNGHIGFNEPGSSLGSRTRVQTLTKTTLTDNSRLFGAGEFQPKLAMTMGIATILEAREVILLATGDTKAEAVRQAVEGGVSARWPATALQMHPHTTIVIDDAAAGALSDVNYYRHAFLENS